MAFDAFIKIDGIPGESTDDKHKDWIEVLSYSWGVKQSGGGGSKSTAGARATGRSDHEDLTFVHSLDKASAKLFLACCNGTHIKEITMTLNRATGDKQKYMEYKLNDVLISSLKPGGSTQGEEAIPMEEVSLNYGKITLTYTATDHKTGKPAGDISANWDCTINKGG